MSTLKTSHWLSILTRAILRFFFLFVKFIEPAWNTFHPTYPTRNSEPQGLIVYDDIILFSGFTDNYTKASRRIYARNVAIFDGNTTWRRMEDMPLSNGVTHMATVKVGSVVYLCGGYYGGHPGSHSPLCLRYNHSTIPNHGTQWAFLPNLPNGGTGGGGMIYSTKHNTLYYAGGGQRLRPGSSYTRDVNNTWKLELHNARAGWKPSAPLPYLANHISYVTHRDSNGTERHFMLGGQISEEEHDGNLNYNYEFIPDNETWIARTPIPFPRGHAASSTRMIGCGFIIAGGAMNNPDPTSRKRISIDDVSYYNIYTDQWTTSIGTLPSIGNTPIVDIHSNGYMYFVNSRLSQRRRIGVPFG